MLRLRQRNGVSVYTQNRRIAGEYCCRYTYFGTQRDHLANVECLLILSQLWIFDSFYLGQSYRSFSMCYNVKMRNGYLH